MSRILALLALSLLMAAPASAQLTLGPGGSVTTIHELGQTKDVGDLFVELEGSVNLDENGKNWLGIMAAYDHDVFVGMGLRYYRPIAGSALYPGIGLSVYRLGEDILSESATMIGGEFLLEMTPTVGNISLPLKAFIGFHGSTDWIFRDSDEVSMFRYGVMITPELPQS
jgi:hypothetical protein